MTIVEVRGSGSDRRSKELQPGPHTIYYQVPEEHRIPNESDSIVVPIHVHENSITVHPKQIEGDLYRVLFPALLEIIQRRGGCNLTAQDLYDGGINSVNLSPVPDKSPLHIGGPNNTLLQIFHVDGPSIEYRK